MYLMKGDLLFSLQHEEEGMGFYASFNSCAVNTLIHSYLCLVVFFFYILLFIMLDVYIMFESTWSIKIHTYRDEIETWNQKKFPPLRE